MSPRITCPSCSGTFRAKPELAGRRVRCPECLSTFQVPAAPAEPANAPAATGRPSWLTLAAAVVVALAVGVAGSFVAGHRQGKAANARVLTEANGRDEAAAPGRKGLEAELAAAKEDRDRDQATIKDLRAQIAEVREKADRAEQALALVERFENPRGGTAAEGEARRQAEERRRADAAGLRVEEYLHSGNLKLGDSDLQRLLDRDPTNDRLRLGLGVLQFVRAVEQLGQELYQYGVRSDDTTVMFLRIPIPKNPKPAAISHLTLQRMLAHFADNLAKAEATLAKIADDKVTLPVRLAGVRLDLTGGGAADDRLVDILNKLMVTNRFATQKDNPDFRVRFDRGDVAWLRGYCHLLSGLLDAYLAVDGQLLFDAAGGDLFARPEVRAGLRLGPDGLFREEVRITDPARLRSFQAHMLKVCELTRDTWRFIRAERDDDQEWLPHPRQNGVLGIPMTDEGIDGWLVAISELEGLLTGKKRIPPFGPARRPETGARGVNLGKFLDEPPAKLVIIDLMLGAKLDDKYLGELTKGNQFDITAFQRLATVFGDGMGMPYATTFK